MRCFGLFIVYAEQNEIVMSETLWDFVSLRFLTYAGLVSSYDVIKCQQNVDKFHLSSLGTLS